MNKKLSRSLTKHLSRPSEESPLPSDLSKRNTNIKVISRFRPFLPLEHNLGLTQALKFEFISDTTVLVPCGSSHEPYIFDRALDSNVSQGQVYACTGAAMVSDVLEGYNGTIFAYGQTGSGKTFTMLGSLADPDKRGIIPRAAEQIFRTADRAPVTTEFTLKCSMLEIYKETLRDLLGDCDGLKIKESPSRGIYVENLTEVFVAEQGEMLQVLETGEKARTVASTRMNQYSSRSHSLFTLEIRQKLENEVEKKGVLNLIDLAGSEKLKDSGVSGMNLEEAKKINLSLSALGNVIHALTVMAEHVPYRDSKLTRLLQESLGGNYKTALVVTCSPALSNIDETIRTLKFAQRAKKIKTTAKINVKNSADGYLKIIQELK
jgi:kinesin family member 5